jgi:hypothetical protein
LKTVDAKDGSAAVAIKLEPARTLAGRTVDSKGEPIPDVSVFIGGWRGYSSTLGVNLKTDAQGRFRWEDAPADSVGITVDRPGFLGVGDQRVTAGNDVLITLKRAISIRGKIRDAKTEKRIDEAGVELGAPDPKTGAFAWTKNLGVWASQGDLQANVDVERMPEFRLRFQARGYEASESRSFHGDEGQVEYDVRMTPTDKTRGVSLTGRVARPDGTPLAEADVVLTYPTGGGSEGLTAVHIENGTIRPDAQLVRTQTDAEGRFTLISQSRGV